MPQNENVNVPTNQNGKAVGQTVDRQAIGYGTRRPPNTGKAEETLSKAKPKPPTPQKEGEQEEEIESYIPEESSPKVKGEVKLEGESSMFDPVFTPENYPFMDNVFNQTDSDSELLTREWYYKNNPEEDRSQDYGPFLMSTMDREPAGLGKAKTVKEKISQGFRSSWNSFTEGVKKVGGPKLKKLDNYTGESTVHDFFRVLDLPTGIAGTLGSIGAGFFIGGPVGALVLGTAGALSIAGLQSLTQLGFKEEEHPDFDTLLSVAGDIWGNETLREMGFIGAQWDKKSDNEKLLALWKANLFNNVTGAFVISRVGKALKVFKKTRPKSQASTIRAMKNTDRVGKDADVTKPLAEVEDIPKIKPSVEDIPKINDGQKEYIRRFHMTSSRTNKEGLDNSVNKELAEEMVRDPDIRKVVAEERKLREFNSAAGRSRVNKELLTEYQEKVGPSKVKASKGGMRSGVYISSLRRAVDGLTDVTDPDTLVSKLNDITALNASQGLSEEGLIGTFTKAEQASLKGTGQSIDKLKQTGGAIPVLYDTIVDLKDSSYRAIKRGADKSVIEAHNDAIGSLESARELLLTKAGGELQSQQGLSTSLKILDEAYQNVNLLRDRIKLAPGWLARRRLVKELAKQEKKLDELNHLSKKMKSAPLGSHPLFIVTQAAVRDNMLAGNAFVNATVGTAINYGFEAVHDSIKGVGSLAQKLALMKPRTDYSGALLTLPKIPLDTLTYVFKRTLSSNEWKLFWKDLTVGSLEHRYMSGILDTDTPARYKILNALATPIQMMFRELDRFASHAFASIADDYAVRKSFRHMIANGVPREEVLKMGKLLRKGKLHEIPPEMVVQYRHQTDIFNRAQQYRLDDPRHIALGGGTGNNLLSSIGFGLHRMAGKMRKNPNPFFRELGQFATPFTRPVANGLDWMAYNSVFGLLGTDLPRKLSNDKLRMAMGTLGALSLYFAYFDHDGVDMYSSETDSSIKFRQGGGFHSLNLTLPNGKTIRADIKQLGDFGRLANVIHRTNVHVNRMLARGASEAELLDYFEEILPLAAIPFEDSWINFSLPMFLDMLKEPTKIKIHQFENFVPGTGILRKVKGAVRGRTVARGVWYDSWNGKVRDMVDAFGRKHTLQHALVSQSMESTAQNYKPQAKPEWFMKTMKFLYPRLDVVNKEEINLHRFLLETGGYTNADGFFFKVGDSFNYISKDALPDSFNKLLGKSFSKPDDFVTFDESGLKSLKLTYRDYNDALNGMSLQWEKVEPVLKMWQNDLTGIEDPLNLFEVYREDLKKANIPRGNKNAMLATYYRRAQAAQAYLDAMRFELNQSIEQKGRIKELRNVFQGIVPSSIINDQSKGLYDMLGYIASIKNPQQLSKHPQLAADVNLKIQAYRQFLSTVGKEVLPKDEKATSRFAFKQALKSVIIDYYNFVAEGAGEPNIYYRMKNFAPETVQAHINRLMKGGVK